MWHSESLWTRWSTSIRANELTSYCHNRGPTHAPAQNNPGENPFQASAHTPKKINTLLTPLDVNNNFAPLVGLDLLNKNPNGPLGSGAAINGANASNPFRLTPSQGLTADQGHNDLPEQIADDNGKMD